MSDKQRKLSPSTMIFRGAFIYNPVLVQVIGICPIVAATVSLPAAAVLAAITVLLLIICETFASVALKRVPAWIRVAIYMIIGLLIACPAMYYMDARNYGVATSIGIYLPLLAVSSLAALRCEKFAVRNNPLASFIDAFSAGLGYSVVFLIVGAIRELLGNGTIAGRVIFENPAAPGLLMTFGGFTVVGLLAALHKAIVIRFFPRFEKDMSFKIKTSRAEEQRAASVRGSEKKPSALNRGKITGPDTASNENTGISKTEALPKTSEKVVYVPDIPQGEEAAEQSPSDSEVLPLEETALEIASDYNEPQPEKQQQDETDVPARGDEITPKAADENNGEDNPNEINEYADEFDRDISELFENFRKKHNLDN
jgi:electron transport complex protein RnfE